MNIKNIKNKYINGYIDNWIIELLLILVLGIILGSLTTWGITANSYQKSAIKAGVAHWVIDSETGVRTFEYIKPNKN